MHILVSNHEAEVAAYRRALGPTAADLKIVENNLSVLSLVSSHPLDIWSLVITEHQDEGINVETRTFLRNLAERASTMWPTIVVDPVFGDAIHSSVRVVTTIEEAAAMVRAIEQPALVEAHAEATEVPAFESNGNGRSTVDLLSTRAIVHPKPQPSVETVAEPAHVTRTYAYDGDASPVAAPSADMTPVMASPFVETTVAPTVDEATVAEPLAPLPPQTPVVVSRPVQETPASSAPTQPFVVPQPVREPVAHAAPVASTVQPSASAEAPPAFEVSVPPERIDTFEGRDEPARSLADDIRDWTQRNEQQRSQHQVRSNQKSVWQGLMDLMPANRRAAAEEDALDRVIRDPRLSRCQSIAVISPKGGVGKSFLTYLIGNFLAEVRGDKVVAIDTNPDFGTLADQVRGREQQTVSTLLEKLDEINHYSDLRRFTSKVESRLEVLAAPADPDVMATITSLDYSRVNTQLQHYYDTVLFDCGTGFRDDITRFALERADQVVLVSAPLFITTGIVVRALAYLDQVGVPLDRVTLAINQVRRDAPLDLNYMRERFGDRLNAIVEIPFDMNLYHDLDRGEFSVAHTQQATRIKVKQLLAELVKHFV